MRAVCGRVFLGVLVGRVGGDLRRDVLANALGHPIGVGEQGGELLVEGLQDIAQPIQLGLALPPTRIRRHRFDLRIGVRQSDLHGRFLFHAVAVHVDGFEDAFGEVLLLRRWLVYSDFLDSVNGTSRAA